MKTESYKKIIRSSRNYESNWLKKASVFYAVKFGVGLENPDGWILNGKKYVAKIESIPRCPKQYLRHKKIV